MSKLKALVVIGVVVGAIVGAGVVMGQGDPLCVTGGAVPPGNAALAADCETLLGFMDTLRGTAPLNWSASRPIKQWTGVRLGGTPQRVTIIKLQKRNLDGRIPADIGKLDKLVDIWLYINKLHGPLPAELGNLSDLRTLMLANNNLSGQIPEALNNLTLNRLWLKNNNFTGCVPYNLTQIADADTDRLGLPTCPAGPPGGDPPAPEPPEPQPPATPWETVLELLTTIHCNEDDIQRAFGEPYSELRSSDLEWDPNGRGWFATRNTAWVNESGSSAITCSTIIYSNAHSAILDSDYDELVNGVDGSRDVQETRKIREDREIGEWFIASHIDLGENRDGLPDLHLYRLTTSLFQRADVVVQIAEIVGSDRPTPSPDRVADASSRIDARLSEIVEESDTIVRGLSTQGLKKASGREAQGLFDHTLSGLKRHQAQGNQ